MVCKGLLTYTPDMQLKRTVFVDRDPLAVFAYLADFTTTTEWDPGTVKTGRIVGDGGVGTRYRNRSRIAGRATELIVEVIERRAGLLRLRGENAGLIAWYTIEVLPHHAPSGPGSRVEYTVRFEFRGVVAGLGWALRPMVTRLVDRGAEGMRAALLRLPGG